MQSPASFQIFIAFISINRTPLGSFFTIIVHAKPVELIPTKQKVETVKITRKKKQTKKIIMILLYVIKVKYDRIIFDMKPV